MKKGSIVLLGILLTISSVAIQTRSNSSDYFIGKWEVIFEGTPNGDATLTLTIDRKDGKLEGFFTDAEEAITKIDRIEENEESITIYWFAQGYDIYLQLEKVDEDNIKGMLMGMFISKGKRLVE